MAELRCETRDMFTALIDTDNLFKLMTEIFIPCLFIVFCVSSTIVVTGKTIVKKGDIIILSSTLHSSGRDYSDAKKHQILSNAKIHF